MARRLIGVDVRTSTRTGNTTYRVRWRDPDSHRQHSHTFTDRAAAIDAKRTIELAGNHCYCPVHCPPDSEGGQFGVRDTTTITWGTYAQRHIANRPGISDHYRAQFDHDLDLHMGPLLGLTFDKLNRDRVAEWIRTLEQAGLSPTTIHRLVVQAGSVQRAALDAGVATGGNPFTKQRTGRRERRREQMHCLTHTQWNTLQAALPEGVPRDLATVLVGTGLRFGEATALRVGNVELDGTRGRLHVAEAWKSDGANGWLLGPPKSARSRRTVSFGAAVADALRPHTDGRGERELVFTTVHGAPIRNANFHHRVWRPAVQAAGLTGVRIHDLRHTHASWLIAAGRPTAAVSRRLGHESIATTDAIYTHILPKTDEGDIAALDEIMPVSPPEEDPPAS
jgi:integrase